MFLDLTILKVGYWVTYSYRILYKIRKSSIYAIHKPPTEAGFPVPTWGTAGYGKTEKKIERPRTP
jgi:hypothetical protein